MLKQSPKQTSRREQFRKIGSAISSFNEKYRIELGQSPNPWRGRKSGYAGPTVMQIVSDPPEFGPVEPVLERLRASE